MAIILAALVYASSTPATTFLSGEEMKWMLPHSILPHQHPKLVQLLQRLAKIPRVLKLGTISSNLRKQILEQLS